MSADHDQLFIRNFLVVLGVLALIAVISIFAARWLVAASSSDEPTQRQLARIEERTEPVFQVATDPAALQKVAATAPAGAAGGGGATLTGKQVYQKVCSTCHDAGIAGSPVVGDKAAWAPRIAKGIDTLYKHAIQGFNMMPPKGGNPKLSDAEVEKAVDYMVQQSGG